MLVYVKEQHSLRHTTSATLLTLAGKGHASKLDVLDAGMAINGADTSHKRTERLYPSQRRAEASRPDLNAHVRLPQQPSWRAFWCHFAPSMLHTTALCQSKTCWA